MRGEPKIAIFPDTNIFLHYPQLKDVDWKKVCNASRVVVVICMQVIRELDGKKDDPRLGERARRAIKEIRGIRASDGKIREDVELEIFNHEMRLSDFPDSLSPESPDDRIVHFAKQFSKVRPGCDVRIYSEDLGMAIRCEGHGIAVIEPDKICRLENPQTEEQKKYQQVVTELHQLKKLQPKIKVTLYTPGDSRDGPMRIDLKRPPEVDIEMLIQLERQVLGLPDPAAPPLHGALADMNMLLSRERWGDYVDRCNKYIEEYRKWLTEDAMLRHREAMEFSFSVSVANTGTTVGDDVDVYLKFPPVLEFLEDCEEGFLARRGRVSEKPKPPGRPGLTLWSTYSSHLDTRSLTVRPAPFTMPKFTVRGVPWSSISGTGEAGFAIRMLLQKLNHHKHCDFGPFRACFSDWDHAAPFEVQLAIIAGNMVEKMESRIPAPVAVSDGKSE